jgi:hypothetical protein
MKIHTAESGNNLIIEINSKHTFSIKLRHILYKNDMTLWLNNPESETLRMGYCVLTRHNVLYSIHDLYTGRNFYGITYEEMVSLIQMLSYHYREYDSSDDESGWE